MLRALRRLSQNRKGQALVEIALVLPILCLLLMGLVEFGRAFHAYLILSHASREGARAAALGQGDWEVQALVVGSAATLDPNSLQVSITPAEGARTRGEGVTVRTVYQLPIMVPLIIPMLPDPFPIQTATTMRME